MRPSVWLVTFRHKTRTPRYVAAVDVYVYADSEKDAQEKGLQARKAHRLSARWWDMAVAPTQFEELPHA